MHSRIKHCLVSIILFLLVHFSVAQQLSFKHYTIQEGLSSMMQYSILQDKQGFIWTCNDGGISRFDGKEFKHISINNGLQDNEILNLFEDSKGRIWYTTLKGSIGLIIDFQVNNLATVNKVLFKRVYSINEDCKGNILLGLHRDGLMKLSPDFSHVEYVSKSCFGYKPLYFNCEDNSIIDFSIRAQIRTFKNGHTDVQKIPVLKYDIADGHACSTISAEKKYFFTNGHGVASIDSKNKISLEVDDSLTNKKSIISICVDNENNLWLGTYNGLLCYKRINNKYTYAGTYLNTKKISYIFQDNEKNIWISTLGEGLYQMLSNKVLTISDENGLSDNSLLCIQKFNNNLYLGSEKGFLNVINFTPLGTKATFIKQSNKVQEARIIKFCVYKKHLLIGTDQGIIYLKGNLLVRMAEKEFNRSFVHAVKDLYADSTDTLYLGLANGLVRYNNSKCLAISRNRTTAVYKDSSGKIWFSDDKGFGYVLNGETVRDFHNSELSERLLHIREDSDHTLWMASQGKGLIYLRNGIPKVINKTNGLSSNICNSFYLDSNKIWVATNEGISVIEFKDKSRTKFSIQNISTTQGLASNKIFSITKIGKTVFAATNNGLSYFNEDDVKPNNIPPPVYISGIKIWEKDTTIKPEYELAYNENNIKIEFIGLSYKSLGKIKYKYKIEGLDTNWITTSYNVASYPSLPVGKYHFLVKAINNNGIESETAASLSIIVYPPFWLTTWCKCIWLLLILLIVFLIYYYRLKRIKVKNDLQKQIMEAEQYALRSQMNPHFVFNALNSIQRFMLQKDPLMANEYLSKFGNLIRRIFENSMHAYIPIHDEIETLKLYIQIESLRFDNAFEYNLIIDEQLDKYNIEIPPMIIQPYVENAIWHGLLHKPKKGVLIVEIRKLPEKIVCIIEDNGIGRQKSATLKSESANMRNSAGMKITEKRLKNLTELTQKLYNVTAVDLFDNENNPAGTRIIIEFSDIQ